MLLRKNDSRCLVKAVRKTFSRGTTARGFVVGERDGAQYQVQVVIYSKAAGWGSVDGRALRGNIKGEGDPC